ncbi:hypothetical protein ES708_22343 [subsurface metagenome]
MRETFFQAVGEYLSGTAEQQILAQVEALLASEDVDEEDKVLYREIGEQVPTVFSSTRDLHTGLAKVRKTLQEAIPGGFCIIGWTGTSTTDIGVNPFEEEYMNVLIDDCEFLTENLRDLVVQEGYIDPSRALFRVLDIEYGVGRLELFQ